jgi:hypothetical protein
MAKLTIRVELHGATRSDYDDLAKRLARHKITDVIVSSDGTRYKLPPAEYSYVGSATCDEVYSAAKSVAGSLNRKFAILASESIKRSWEGLPPA